MNPIRVLRGWWRRLTENEIERKHRERSPSDLDVEDLPKGDLDCDHEPGNPLPDSSCRCLKCGRLFTGNYGGPYRLKCREGPKHEILCENVVVRIQEVEWYILEAETHTVRV